MNSEEAPTAIAPAIGPCITSLAMRYPFIKAEIDIAPIVPAPIPSKRHTGLEDGLFEL